MSKLRQAARLSGATTGFAHEVGRAQQTELLARPERHQTPRSPATPPGASRSPARPRRRTHCRPPPGAPDRPHPCARESCPELPRRGGRSARRSAATARRGGRAGARRQHADHVVAFPPLALDGDVERHARARERKPARGGCRCRAPPAVGEIAPRRGEQPLRHVAVIDAATIPSPRSRCRTSSAPAHRRWASVVPSPPADRRRPLRAHASPCSGARSTATAPTAAPGRFLREVAQHQRYLAAEIETEEAVVRETLPSGTLMP